jgi:hypothetical protein
LTIPEASLTPAQLNPQLEMVRSIANVANSYEQKSAIAEIEGNFPLLTPG